MLITLQECERQQRYAEALGYAKKFAEIINQVPELRACHEKILQDIDDQAKKRQAEILASVQANAENLIRQQKAELLKIEEQRRQELDTQRKIYLLEIKKLIQSEKYKKALDYYQSSLPEYLQNRETQAMYETICDTLNADIIARAKHMFGQKQYVQALSELATIPTGYHTTQVRHIQAEIQEQQASELQRKKMQQRDTARRFGKIGGIIGIVILLVFCFVINAEITFSALVVGFAGYAVFEDWSNKTKGRVSVALQVIGRGCFLFSFLMIIGLCLLICAGYGRNRDINFGIVLVLGLVVLIVVFGLGYLIGWGIAWLKQR